MGDWLLGIGRKNDWRMTDLQIDNCPFTIHYSQLVAHSYWHLASSIWQKTIGGLAFGL